MNNYANSSIVLQNLFTGLMQIGPDGSLINGCAESYEVSEDGAHIYLYAAGRLKVVGTGSR